MHYSALPAKMSWSPVDPGVRRFILGWFKLVSLCPHYLSFYLSFMVFTHNTVCLILSGIGLMIASTFYRHGANVLLTSRDPKACEEAAKTIISQQQEDKTATLSSSVHHVSSNVSSREGCKKLAEYTNKVFNGR